MGDCPTDNGDTAESSAKEDSKDPSIKQKTAPEHMACQSTVADPPSKPQAAGMSEHQTVWQRLYMVPAFLAYLAYIQACSVAAFVVIMMGSSLTHADVCQHFTRILRVRWSSAPGSRPVLDDSSRPVVYLCNHRSWGDFWVESAILGGTSFVSRWAVAMVIPFSALWGYSEGWLWFFDRSTKKKNGWVTFMQDFFTAQRHYFPHKGLVLYPEGTRSQLPRGSPLKEGGLRSVYKLGWPVQVVISTGKERIMLESQLSLRVGVEVVTAVSPALWPRDFDTPEAFVDKVRTQFAATWADAAAATDQGTTCPRQFAALPGVTRRTKRSNHGRLTRARLLAVLVVIACIWLRARMQ